jgi:hypothetical protein
MLCNGLFHHEFFMFWTLIKERLGYVFASIRAFMCLGWVFPGNQCSHNTIKEVFSDRRETAGKTHFLAQGSEVLAVYPSVRAFVEEYVMTRDILHEQCLSFNALCLVIDVIQKIKKDKTCIGELEAVQFTHGAAHKLAYGVKCIPKHHYNRHIGRQVNRDGMVIDGFPTERKNGTMTRIADPIKNTRSFEKSVTSRILIQQCRQLGNLQVGDGLCGKASMQYDGTVYSAGDVFYRRQVVYREKMFLQSRPRDVGAAVGTDYERLVFVCVQSCRYYDDGAHVVHLQN